MYSHLPTHIDSYDRSITDLAAGRGQQETSLCGCAIQWSCALGLKQNIRRGHRSLLRNKCSTALPIAKQLLRGCDSAIGGNLKASQLCPPACNKSSESTCFCRRVASSFGIRRDWFLLIQRHFDSTTRGRVEQFWSAGTGTSTL